MNRRPIQVLLAEDDVDLVDMIDRCLQGACGACVTQVSTARDALREELTTRHDVIIASTSLPGGEGLGLVRALRANNRAPVILLATDPTVDQAVEAIQLHVWGLFRKPFDVADLVSAVQDTAERQRRRRHLRRRQRRLKQMVSRIVRERRDLRQRMDLICQDLVHAYRALAQKVAESGMLTCDP